MAALESQTLPHHSPPQPQSTPEDTALVHKGPRRQHRGGFCFRESTRKLLCIVVVRTIRFYSTGRWLLEEPGAQCQKEKSGHETTVGELPGSLIFWRFSSEAKHRRTLDFRFM
ncbi:hypothetical protein DPEC_G00252300 [Dallia pectoralis]|uniref:Uncharacterized protein n=1 Tax=Dallia pectoralis TaxID=75939 RepID=A0ACC2FTL5_DALPE|nr:hypothetical protein DPEC_G00252300 [Dallia pectoralis]